MFFAYVELQVSASVDIIDVVKWAFLAGQNFATKIFAWFIDVAPLVKVSLLFSSDEILGARAPSGHVSSAHFKVFHGDTHCSKRV